MGIRSPHCNAWVKKLTVICCRWGRPKEILLTPSTVARPSSSVTYRTARSVSAACSCWADTVSVRQSIQISDLGMPTAIAASMIRFAMATLSCHVRGIPFSSMQRPTTAAPYFLHSGKTASNDARLPLTEFTAALPFTARSPAAMATGSEESICTGKSLTACTARTARAIISASSSPGRPTFTSRISAPASCWAMARDATASMSPWRSACCSVFFPVGLMRSPMTCTPSVATALVAEQMPLRFTPWRRATSPPPSSKRPNAAM